MIVGIAGYKGSGKSTAARFLTERRGFVRIPLASPLKDMLRAIGLDDSELEGDRKEEPCVVLNGVTPRRAMQTLGTEWGRDLIHPNLWIDLWKRRVSRAGSLAAVVVDDVRFQNEVDAVHTLGGWVIRIIRPDRIASNHASEADVDGVDTVIENAHDIADLHRLLDDYLFPRQS